MVSMAMIIITMIIVIIMIEAAPGQLVLEPLHRLRTWVSVANNTIIIAIIVVHRTSQIDMKLV